MLLVTPCLVVAVQPCMEWIPIKKKKVFLVLLICSHWNVSLSIAVVWFNWKLFGSIPHWTRPTRTHVNQVSRELCRWENGLKNYSESMKGNIESLFLPRKLFIIVGWQIYWYYLAVESNSNRLKSQMKI